MTISYDYRAATKAQRKAELAQWRTLPAKEARNALRREALLVFAFAFVLSWILF